MSAFIEARIQEALSGAGYMKESVFQQAMVVCQRIRAKEWQLWNREQLTPVRNSFMNFFQSNYYVYVCIICNISEVF